MHKGDSEIVDNRRVDVIENLTRGMVGPPGDFSSARGHIGYYGTARPSPNRCPWR